ncbi:MAG: hypothetical protein KJN59_07340 [Bacteroidia bacterium]|nr:hypothetical protein [Bacteroidia bacterium]
MSTLKNLTSKDAKSSFDKKVLAAVQHLHPYIKHRIYIGETKGILPKNMYKSVDIVDEGIAKLYMKGYDVDAEAVEVKLELFKIIDIYLETLLEKEAFHQNTISTSEILNEELNRLREDFTMDADLDLILNTELDDISYHQNGKEHHYLYTDKDVDVLHPIEDKDFSLQAAQMAFQRIYTALPMKVSNIVDLHTFGKLEVEEIAEIRELEKARIQRIIETVKRRFSDYI